MKRILLLVSGSGGGHIQAGKNIASALAEIDPTAEVVLKNSYDFVSPFQRWQLTRGWELAFQYFRPVYAAGRRRVNSNPRSQAAMRKRFEGSGRAFVEWLAQQPRFDAVISTQPHGAGIGSIAKRDSRFAGTYLAQVWTDFWYYGLYYAPGVDRYFAAAEEFAAAAKVEHPDIKVTVSGVPIDPKFSANVDALAARRHFSLSEDGKPVVLIARGSLGYGAGFTLALLDQLARSGLPITIVANAGRNTALTARMREVLQRAQPEHQPHVLDWIDNMHELLAVTDVTVAKPGGLAVAEAMARGIPFVGFAPIPGQEEANLKFLERHGAGRHALSPDAAVAAVRELVEHPDVLSAVKARARAVGHPDAARVVAKQVLADV